MTAPWIKYTGSDEQIAEIRNAENGYVLQYESGRQELNEWELDGIWNVLGEVDKTTHYLICQPHPLADMICQWARTGQPVWVRYAKVCHFGQTSEYEICNQIATPTPDWNMKAEYSFTPFEEEV